MSQVPGHHRKGSWTGTVKAVLWGFLGVRRRVDFHHDVAKLNPLHILAVGLVMALLFVALLMVIVNWVVR